MEHLTPHDAFFGIGGGLALVIVVMILRAFWPEIAAIGRAFWARYILSSSEDAPADDPGAELVSIPVSRTSIADNTGAPVSAPADHAGADIDVPNAGIDGWQAPRVSARLSDDETIVLLAMQRRPNGKFRYSANAIYALVGGNRNALLARVSEVRSGAPEYRPLTAEQQQLREQLQLNRR